MIKRIIHTTTLVGMFVWVVFGALSCKRVDSPTDNGKGPIELELLGVISADANATKAATEKLPIGTEVRVEAYTAGTYNTDSPALLQQGVYIVTQSDGTMYPKTADERILLAVGTYDFHVFSPPYAHTAGSDIDVNLDDCFLNYVIENKAFNIDDRLVSVAFDRFSSRLDIVLKVKEKAFIQSLAVNSAGDRKAILRGLPIKSTVVGTTTYAAASTDRAGIVEFDLSRFVASGTGLSSVLSTETNPLGAAIVGATDYPGSTAEPVKFKIELPLLVNGKEKLLSAELKTGFHTKPGFRYKVEVSVDRDGEPEFNVVAEQWVPGLSTTTPSVRGGYKVGDYLSGGEIVFWVNPFDKEHHYKTMYINRNPSMMQNDAIAYATAMGDGWHLPSLSECREIVAHQTVINASLVKTGVPSISDVWYLTSDLDADGVKVKVFALGNTSGYAGNVNTGSLISSYPSYSVKEHGSGAEYLDYTTMSANCYIAYPKTEGGDMQPIVFNALRKPRYKYKPGSTTGLINTLLVGSNPSPSSTDAALSNDIVYQSGDKLEVVWQTAVNHASSGAMVIQSLDLTSEGFARVQINGPGNAVVAYKRGSTILWNYHIWATDSDPFVNHYATGSNVNGTVEGGAMAQFMDRNLGALAATTSKPAPADAYKYFGIMYQYGRPTPFTGQGPETAINTYPVLFNQNGIAYPVVNNNKRTGGYSPVNDAVGDITTAIRNPMTWYYKSITNYTWNSLGEVALWSNFNTTKSIYDPCPYGYRVPKNGSWTGIPFSNWTAAIDGGAATNGTWWPATGFRWGDSDVFLTYVGSYGYYWSSTLHSSVYFSYLLSFSSNGSLSPSHNTHRSTGASVRCVQEGY